VSIILVADPTDEIDEVWDQARENTLEGGLLALGQCRQRLLAGGDELGRELCEQLVAIGITKRAE